jgi:phage shock protein C
MVKKKLKLSNNKMIAGVCGGIAEYFDTDPNLVRIEYILLTFITLGFGGAIIYLIAWFIMSRS